MICTELPPLGVQDPSKQGFESQITSDHDFWYASTIPVFLDFPNMINVKDLRHFDIKADLPTFE